MVSLRSLPIASRALFSSFLILIGVGYLMALSYMYLVVLPEGFHRIRYYGFLGNRHRAQKLARCRELLGMTVPELAHGQAEQDYRDRYEKLTGDSLTQCPVCRQGRMIIIKTIDGGTTRPPVRDTS
jgi:hypothetical protein